MTPGKWSWAWVAVATLALLLASGQGPGAAADNERSRRAAVRAVDAASNRDASPARRTWTVVGDPILLAAGDIAGCGWTGDETTSAILDGYPDSTVAALGDLAYDDGTTTEFASCYGPSWGRHKARTRPAAGNHEYHTAGATGYFGYFGAAAGAAGKGYYSYDRGAWHVVVLNSNCEYVSCAAGSEQEQWLRADLAASEAQCTLAYWHRPLFTSGFHAGEPNLQLVRPLWDALYAEGADVVLGGHDHDYERFAPQTPSGAADGTHGLRQFVVGTGGAPLRAFGATAANSEVRESTTLGVLRLVLRSGGYDWQFLAEAGKTFTDTGSGACHAAPPETTPPTSPTLTSSHSSEWSSDRTVDVTWSGASDEGSGVDGFSYSWTTNATDSPDLVKDAEETTTGTTSNELADGSWWFHIRTRDNAGNWSGAVHLGPFRIDGTAPTNPAFTTPGHAVDSWSNDPTVDVGWTGASDLHSGVDGYSYDWSSSATTVPDQTKDAWAASSPRPDGSWWFHLRTVDRAGNWSGAVHLGPFKVDTTAPDNPALHSPSHAVGAWSNDPTVDVTWPGAADGGSGVDGYSFAWSQDAATSPDETKDTSTTAPTLADGSWWFHLRTRDNAGNWSLPVHLGPFRIDTAPPANPTLSSPSHAAGDWSNDPTVEASWSGAADSASGVDGYSYEWTKSESTTPDATKEPAGSTTTSPTLDDGSWWFHLRTVDLAGNWSGAAHLGPFRIDTTAPTNPTVSSPSHVIGTWSNVKTVLVQWSGSDGEGYSYEWSHVHSTIPDDVVEGNQRQVESDRPDGAWWFHVRAHNAANSWSGTSHQGPFLIDTTPPETDAVSTSDGFVLTASEPGSFVCSLDDAPYAACVSPVRYDGLAPGNHVFRAFARDRAGNTDASPAEVRWTIAPTPQPQPPPPPQPQPQPPPPRQDRVLRCVVPRLAGLTLKRARTLLVRGGCTLGRVARAYSPKVRSGRVLLQRPKPGARLARGARVSVVLSRGPRPRRR